MFSQLESFLPVIASANKDLLDKLDSGEIDRKEVCIDNEKEFEEEEELEEGEESMKNEPGVSAESKQYVEFNFGVVPVEDIIDEDDVPISSDFSVNIETKKKPLIEEYMKS